MNLDVSSCQEKRHSLWSHPEMLQSNSAGSNSAAYMLLRCLLESWPTKGQNGRVRSSINTLSGPAVFNSCWKRKCGPLESGNPAAETPLLLKMLFFRPIADLCPRLWTQ